MDKLNMEYADTSSYKTWIQAGIVLLALGMFVGGLGELFAKDVMNTLGNFFRIPGGVLITTGLAIAGVQADELSNGVRIASLICAGILGMYVYG